MRRQDLPQCGAAYKCRDLDHCRQPDTCPILLWLRDMTLAPDERGK